MIEWLITMITFFLGYALGRDALTKKNLETVGKIIKDKVFPVKLGAVTRPSAGRLNQNPQEEMANKEVKKALDKLQA